MKRLYTPFKVNKLELKNRVIMSPMSIVCRFQCLKAALRLSHRLQ